MIDLKLGETVVISGKTSMHWSSGLAKRMREDRDADGKVIPDSPVPLKFEGEFAGPPFMATQVVKQNKFIKGITDKIKKALKIKNSVDIKVDYAKVDDKGNGRYRITLFDTGIPEMSLSNPPTRTVGEKVIARSDYPTKVTKKIKTLVENKVFKDIKYFTAW